MDVIMEQQKEGESSFSVASSILWNKKVAWEMLLQSLQLQSL